MTPVLVIVFLPFFLSLFGFLFPEKAKGYALAPPGATALAAGWVMLTGGDIHLTLVESFGVTLALDRTAAWLLLTNAFVSLAVLIYCRTGNFQPTFYNLMLLMHGGVNGAFVCGDLFSLYVTIELTTIVAFLLIAYPMRKQSMWHALRYLLVNNTAMLLYLMGTVLVYESTLSFALGGINQAPPAAAALIMIGLIVKGGIFIPGFWLPAAHSQAETPVSAMLSGVVVKIGVFPLMKIALLAGHLEWIIRGLGVAGALAGLVFALLETDVKRLLAFHTISQIGFMLAAPVAGAFYAFSHGLVKSSLFLGAGALPSKDLTHLKKTGIDRRIWAALFLSALSISGVPVFAGYGAKALVFRELQNWQTAAMIVAAAGTAISFAKFVFLPRIRPFGEAPAALVPMSLLLSGLALYGILPGVYGIDELLKAGATLAAGWVAYLVLFSRIRFRLPTRLERFQDLVGMMCLMLLALLWAVAP